MCLVDATELAVVPGRATALDELERDALLGLAADHRDDVVGEFARRIVRARSA